MSNTKYCDSSKQVPNNCGMLCWLQDDEKDCGWDKPDNNEVELSFQNNKLCCMNNVTFYKGDPVNTLSGYNCSLNKDNNTLHLGNIINWPNTKVLFVSYGDQDTDKMYKKLLSITDNGNNT